MKIAVIAANGKAGRLIVEEAVNRGLDVTAITRGENKSAATKSISKDILALTKNDLKDFDVVIDAFGAWKPEELSNHTKTSQHLCDLLSGTETRLLIVGGAGSLYVDREHTVQISEKANLPADWKPIIDAAADALNELRKRNDAKWTYISPALWSTKQSAATTFAREFPSSENNFPAQKIFQRQVSAPAAFSLQQKKPPTARRRAFLDEVLKF